MHSPTTAYAPFISHVELLEKLLTGADPIAFIDEPDDGWMRTQLAYAAQAQQFDIETLDSGGRWQSFDQDGKWCDVGEHESVETFLALHRDPEGAGQRPRVLWLRGAGALSEQSAVSAAKDLVERIDRLQLSTRVLVTGADPAVPGELAYAQRMHALPRPKRGRLEDPGSLEVLVASSAGLADHPPIAADDLAKIVNRLEGLSAAQVVRVLARAMVKVSEGQDLLAAVIEERSALVEHGILKLHHVDASFANGIAGMRRLVDSFDKAKRMFGDWRDGDAEAKRSLFKIMPRGVLLVGPPGCGKSLSARVAAASLAVPLLELQMGAVMDRWQGSSEQRFDFALKTAEESAPCVLLIDEIERAVGGIEDGGQSGTGGRLLARLLGWLGSPTAPVFVVATANGVERLPEALLRRGRFDEKFVVNLPRKDELAAILDLKLRNFGSHLDYRTLENWAGQKLKDFSGADVDTLVREAAQEAWVRGRSESPSLPDLEAALEAGFGRQSHNYSQLLKDLERDGFVSAGYPEGDPRGRRLGADGVAGEQGIGPPSTRPRGTPENVEKWPAALWLSHGGYDFRIDVDGKTGTASVVCDRNRVVDGPRTGRIDRIPTGFEIWFENDRPRGFDLPEHFTLARSGAPSGEWVVQTQLGLTLPRT